MNKGNIVKCVNGQGAKNLKQGRAYTVVGVKTRIAALKPRYGNGAVPVYGKTAKLWEPVTVVRVMDPDTLKQTSYLASRFKVVSKTTKAF